MSKIIAIEGPDRCGKATQSFLLCAYLTSLGYRARVVEVPIQDTFTYPLVYWMLGNGLAKKFPKFFQRLQVLNRQIFQATELKHWEKDFDYLIFDRWSLSTTVYGLAAGLSMNYVDALYEKLRKPDHTFVLLGASHPHEAEDVYESDTDLQRRVREHYSDWASENLDICSVINCEQPREVIASTLRLILKERGIVPITHSYC